MTAVGFYTWVATYSGDANNESATHPCGQVNETVEATKAAARHHDPGAAGAGPAGADRRR